MSFVAGGLERGVAVRARGRALARNIARDDWCPGNLRRRGLGRVALEQPEDGPPHTAKVRADLHEHLGGDALALPNEAEEDVLGPDVGVAELKGFAQRKLEHLLGAWRERDVSRRFGLALADDLLDPVADGLEGDVE